MKTYRISVNRRGSWNTTGPKEGVWTVEASAPAVALKRLLDGGHEANYKFATVGASRLELAVGESILVKIERV